MQGNAAADSVRDGLVAELTTLARGGNHASRFHLVCGDRGVGKTFVGQELFRRLAEDQPKPGFWPADLIDPERPVLEEDRHTTRPRRIEIPADAIPSFAWIGVNCERAVDGLAYNSLGAASTQVKRLQVAVESVLHAGRAGRSREILVDLLEVVTAFVSLTQDPTGTALGLALAVRPAHGAYRELAEGRAERDDVRGDDGAGWQLDVGRPDPAIVATYCRLLRDLTERVALPTVLFLDDLQHADPTLLSLLEVLPEEVPRNLTVLCTAERTILDAQEREAGGGIERAGAWLAAGRLPQLARAELGPLDDSALRELVVSHAPRTAAETVAALAHHSEGNPYRLRLLLDSPRAQPQEGEILLSPREVMTFPNRLENLYRMAWAYLPAPARRVVAIAAMQGRAVSSGVLGQTCSHLGIENVEEHLADALDQQWLIAGVSGALVFPDEPRHAVAVAESDAADVLGEQERRRAGTRALALAVEAMLEPLTGWVDEETTAAADVLEWMLPYLETVATLAALYPTETPSQVVDLSRVFGDFLRERGEPVLAATYLASVGEFVRRRCPEQALRALRLELRAAEWLSDSGELDRALTALEEIESTAPGELLAERRTHRHLTFVKGRTLARKGRPHLAAPLLQSIARDPVDDDNLGYRSSSVNVAMSIDVGDVGAGGGEYVRRILGSFAETDWMPWWWDREHCIELQDAICRHGFQRVNAARAATNGPQGYVYRYFSDKAGVLAGNGLWAAGSEVYGDLLAGLEVAAPHHANTIVTIDHRAVLLSKLRRTDEALAEQDRALDLYDRFWKDAGPNLLVARGNRAQTLSRLGRHEEALEELEAVYEEQARVLGDEHPSTLHTRMGKARVLARSGETDTARQLFEKVTEAFHAKLGSEHPESVQFTLMLYGMENDLPGMSIEDLGSDERDYSTQEQDDRRAASYRKTQAEDWALLFHTANAGTRLKRTSLEVALGIGARLWTGVERRLQRNPGAEGA